MLIQKNFSTDKQYGNRFKTDRHLKDLSLPRTFSGVMDRQARFIEKHQLLNQEDWGLFVKQFEIFPDDTDNGWRGEYFGKMMRGACMTYQYTKNEDLYCLLRDTAERILSAQDCLGRFSTYTPPCEFNGWDIWCRKYVLLGLLHFYEICTDEALKTRILQALTTHLDYIVDHIGDGKGKTVDQTSAWWEGINSASILEPVMRMYNLTGKESYLTFARYLIDYLTNGKANIFALALEGTLLPYQYPVIKAYEMMSCFEGLLEYYRVTGQEQCKTAVIRFADAVMDSEITLIGCAGCHHELFNHSVQTQTDTDYTGLMQETCVTVTWMKLCDQLLSLTGEAKYADCIEQSYYNAFCGAVNNNLCTSNGGFLFDSYSPLTRGLRGQGIGGHKNISDTKYYGCCAAIGSAGSALPLLTAVTATQKGIAVNYYEEGTIAINGFSFALRTSYPADGTIFMQITQAPQEQKEILLRIPGFSAANARLSVNGETYCLPVNSAGYYASVDRQWAPGDEILLTLDMHPRIIRPCGMADKPKTRDFFAVLYGPLVLARDERLTPVGTEVALSEKLTVMPECGCSVPCVFHAKVQLESCTMDMIDYGSAGKDWGQTYIEAWIPCK